MTDHDSTLRHRRPGDRIVRVPLTKPERVRVGPAPVPRPLPSPQLILIGGFAGLILLGTLLLLLPFATAPERATTPLDALFTATSAVCVTGLVVVDTGTHWSPFGQAVILALVQLGGLGFMTASTVLFMLLGRRISLRERILLREALGVGSLGDVARLGRNIAAFTVVSEVVGAVLIYLRFAQLVPTGTALWWSLFHSVSAFNNAGFDLFGGFVGLTPFRADAYVVVVTTILVILGSISYVLLADAFRTRSFDRLALNNKLALVGTAAIVIVGTTALCLVELGNPRTLGLADFGTRLLDAFVLAASGRTAGFATLDLGEFEEQSLFLLMALMFVGGASGSTAGGIKVNTFALLAAAVWSAVRGKPRTEAFGREVAQEQVFRALTVTLLAIGLIFAAALILAVAEPAEFLPLLFETVSAFGTAGLSVGVTPTLSEFGRLLIVGLMFVGRLGPLSLMLALTLGERATSYRYPAEDVRIG